MLLTAVIVLASDIYTKHLAKEFLAPDLERGNPFPRWIAVKPGFFDLRWAENTGGAFSFMDTRPWIILLISSMMIIGILIWAFRMPQKQFIVQLSLGLIIGGAIGNLIDRLRYGYVIDFLHFYVIRDGKEYFWPTFNIADVGIVAGIGLFMYLTAFTRLLDPPAKPVEDGEKEAEAPDTGDSSPSRTSGEI